MPRLARVTQNAAMSSRRVLLLQASALLLLAGCGDLITPDELLIPSAQLQAAVDRQLPRTVSAGLFDLQAKVGALRMLPEEDRMAARVAFDMGGPLLGKSYAGSFDLRFGVRYEPSDHSLRATRMETRDLQAPGLPASATAGLERALPVMARLLLGDDVVLHRLGEREARKLDALGRQPGDISVTREGLRVRLLAPVAPIPAKG